VPVANHRRHRLGQRRRHLRALTLDVWRHGCGPRPVDRREQFTVSVGEQAHAVLDQPAGDRVERNAGVFQSGEGGARLLHVLFETETRPAVSPEGVECRRRDRVDRVGADQLLDIERVAVGRILRAGARPEQPLRLRASGGQRLPARRRDDRLVPLVGELRIRNRNLTLQAPQPLTRGGARGRRQRRVDVLGDGGVDAAHEEAGDAGDPRHITAGRGVLLQAGEIRLGHRVVGSLREEEGHVDVHPLADERANRGRSRLRARHLDHHVLASERRPQPARFGDRAFGVVRQQRRHLEAHVSIATASPFVHTTEQIGRVLNVGDRETFIQIAGRTQRAATGRGKRLRVIGAAGDRLLEDGRVRRHAAEAVLLDQTSELAARDEMAADVVEPHGLTQSLQRQQRIRGHRACLSTCCLATATRWSGVKPNFFCSALSGAEAPNVRIPMMAPPRPT
jgi:hypothetical protein